MTSISSISSNNNIQSLSQVGQRNGMQPPPPPPDGEGHGKDGGGLLGAIDSALKSVGIEGGLESIFGKSGTSSTSSTTSADGTETIESSDSSRDAASALNSFLQNLMSALQSQGTDTRSENSTEASSTVEASATQGMPPPPPYGGHGMEGKLQSLISSLTHSSSESTSDTSSDSSSDLENSFQSLVSTLGGNSENTSLSGFLQALSSSMQHHGPVGNVVSTTA